ncbi:MAG: hypothetical protein JXA11_08780 [Phycisphaerae bacterium]|nr:hypothetical protein [Phycisphaerae bacterium]
MTSSKFIGESIEILHDKPPSLSKKPTCPDGFRWRDETFRVVEILRQWRDYERRGRMGRNMRPGNASKARIRGSWGVGRFYFRVRTESGRIFDLYYDRAPKNATERTGAWFLYQELDAEK